jgi:UDP-2-acetamido-3-amino-2,3-dideoxy-glucuronate N-acetyltransferase
LIRGICIKRKRPGIKRYIKRSKVIKQEDKIINISVAGAGYWGKNLIRTFYELDSLYSVCEINRDILANIKKNYPEVKLTADFGDLLKTGKIDAIVIALPAEMHYEYSRKAILSGKSVFVEKPLSLNSRDAEELIRLTKENKCILMVGHLLRYHPAFKKLEEIVKSGELGKIQYIYSNRLNFGKIRKKENILWSFAPHDISMILSLLNREPESVYTYGGYFLNKNIADTTMTLLSFSNGTRAHIFVSWLHPYKSQELVIVGDKKMAVFNDTKSWEEKLLIYPHKVEWKEGNHILDKKDFEKIVVEESEPLKDECSHFIDCIKNKRRPITDGFEGLKVLRVLEASQKSLDTRGIVYLN